ncbi:hypothetical protein LAZ67_11002873 [Cordylochernes scorpioides]|uniref:Uncharacterized protein n=1 Tax=Cordylochernes scorpioides TaxID=51811 RepID=A0ABY6L005_9ARAC|nr:hypothetical protein LAZ67_11002873 [Cordylochernes scorpioides]
MRHLVTMIHDSEPIEDSDLYKRLSNFSSDLHVVQSMMIIMQFDFALTNVPEPRLKNILPYQQPGEQQVGSLLGVNSRAQNWTDIIESSEADENGFIQPRRKRKRDDASTPDSRLPRATATARTEGRSFNRTSRNSGDQTSSTMRTQPQNIKSTRQRVADDRSMQQSSSLDNCVFVEFCPDFTQLQYLQALVKLFGDHRAILQDEWPLPNSGVIAALRPYGQVTTNAPIHITFGEYTVMNSRREAFMMLNDGLKIHRLPTRIDIKVGGETIPAFLSHGIRYNKCHKLSHRRVNCPQNTKAAAEPQVSSPQKSTASIGSMRARLPAPAPMPPAYDTTAAASIPVAHAPVLPAQATLVTIVTDKVLTEVSTSTNKAETPEVKIDPPPQASPQNKEHPVKLKARQQMNSLIENREALAAIDNLQTLGLERETLLTAFTMNGKLDSLLATSNSEQKNAIDILVTRLMALWCSAGLSSDYWTWSISPGELSRRTDGDGAARWSPFVRSPSLVGRARAANSLVLSSVVHHLHGYLPTDSTISKLQARLVRFAWGPGSTAWLPGGVLAHPVSMGGFGLLDVGTQLRLACMKGVQASLRGSLNAYSWLTESGVWLTPLPSGIWLPPRRRRLLKIWEAVSDFLALDHRIASTQQLRDLAIIRGCRFLRPPDLLAAARWMGARIGDFDGPVSPLTRPTRCALADATARSCGAAVTPFMCLTTRTIRRTFERPRLATLPIAQLLYHWQDFVNIPTTIGLLSLRRCAFSGHNADIAVQLALHALPHPLHPASARETCIACGSSDLTLAHRSIRPVIREAFNIIQPDLQGYWLFGKGLDDDALAILASAKSSIHRFFLSLEMRGEHDSLSGLFVPGRYITQQATSHTKTQQGARMPDHQAEAGNLLIKVGSGAGGPVCLPGILPRLHAREDILVGLSSVQLAGKLIEEGLNTLRASPLRKRAERIVLGNVLFFVENSDLVTALRPYGQVTSIIQKMMQLEDSCWADARREAFITLRDGVKISHIPARLDVKSKGVVTHFYVTYGIKCSLCHKQGHKRANCPRKTGVQEDKLVLPVEAPAARTQGWTKPPSTSNTMLAAAPKPADHRPQKTSPTAAVETAPPPSRASNAQQEDLTHKPIPTTSALKNLEAKTSKKARPGVEASLIQAHALQQLRPLNTSCVIVCTHQADPLNTLQPCRAFARGELPCPSLRDSSPRASCSGAEHQPNAITTRALLDQN